MECGLGSYMGLPGHPDIAKLKEVWSLGSEGTVISMPPYFRGHGTTI